MINNNMDEEIGNNTPQRQIINEYLEINEVDSFYDSIFFIHKQSQYHSLGILGPTQTGKSSLMNNLFGTQFPFHSNSKYSKGIFMSYIKNSKWLLIDNEGLDSLYRNEEDKAFYDYVSSVFCFLLCNIIIINILYTDIGRYSASCYDAINLFYQQVLIDKDRGLFNKKKILYVIRDFDIHRHHYEVIAGTIKDDLSSLWFAINKKNYSSFEDYFVLDIITIPSYFHHRKEYYNEIEHLKAKIMSDHFINNIASISIFNDDTHQCQTFKEALGFIVHRIKSQYSFYQSNPRNLMIFYHSLNHKEQINSQFNNQLVIFYDKSRRLLPNFKLEALGIRQTILKAFDAKGIIYNEKICFKVREELDDEISHSFYKAFLRQVYLTTITAQSNMRKTILSLFNQIELKDFFKVFDNLINEAMNNFNVSLIEKKVYDKEWIFCIEKPQSIFNEHYWLISKFYLIQYEKTIDARLTNGLNEIYLQAISHYDETKDSFWSKINNDYQSTISDCLLLEEEHIRDLNKYNEESIQVFISTIKEKSYLIAKECYTRLINHSLCDLAIKQFEHKMLYEDYNCVRLRQLNQFDNYEIDSLAWKYSSFYVTLFDTMRYFRLEALVKKKEYQFNLLSSFTKTYGEIISKDKLNELKNKFNAQVYNITQEIKYISNDTKVVCPLWLWLLLLFFGRKTLLYIMTTKLLIVFLILIGTYIILTQMRLTFIFRTHYYLMESNIRNGLFNIFYRKGKGKGK